jgi:hypothetical protein
MVSFLLGPIFMFFYSFSYGMPWICAGFEWDMNGIPLVLCWIAMEAMHENSDFPLLC